jgi:hypothetical protein
VVSNHDLVVLKEGVAVGFDAAELVADKSLGGSLG